MAEVIGLYQPNAEARKRLEEMSVLVLTPCKDSEVPIAFSRSLANMVAYSWMHGLRVYQQATTERMVVHWARNQLADIATKYSSGYTGERHTHVLWLDDDQLFNPDLALRLASHDVDIVSAVYYGRVGRHLPVVYIKDGEQSKYTHFQMVIVPRQLCEVDAVGFGACLMRMEVLDKMESPWFRFEGCGEDVYFCVRAKECGFKIHVDGSYEIGHIGEAQVVTSETYRQFMESKKEEYGDLIKVHLGGSNGANSMGIGKAD